MALPRRGTHRQKGAPAYVHTPLGRSPSGWPSPWALSRSPSRRAPRSEPADPPWCSSPTHTTDLRTNGGVVPAHRHLTIATVGLVALISAALGTASAAHGAPAAGRGSASAARVVDVTHLPKRQALPARPPAQT